MTPTSGSEGPLTLFSAGMCLFTFHPNRLRYSLTDSRGHWLPVATSFSAMQKIYADSRRIFMFAIHMKRSIIAAALTMKLSGRNPCPHLHLIYPRRLPL